MNLRMGNQLFTNVQIPLLWGKRAIVQDRKGRISIIDLSGSRAKIEILADEPGPGITFETSFSGFKILDKGTALYLYDPKAKRLESINLGLPDCEITSLGIRVGKMQFFGNDFEDFGVGIAVSGTGSVSLGAPLPSDLARLAV